MNDARFLDVLKHSFRDRAPEGYDSWLDRNIAHYDPIARGWRLRDSISMSFRPQHSYKCWDDRCMHYIYGYCHPDDRDRHTREHVLPTKRDSALSMGGSPPLLFPDQPSAGNRSYSVDYPKQASPLYLPRPSSSVQLAPLATGSHPRDQRDTLRAYSFVPEYAGGPRGSVDSEVDPLLPPLKRSRVGQPRLESIGELKLLRDVGPCLRCKVLNKSVRAESARIPFTSSDLLTRVVQVRLERPLRVLSRSAKLPRLRLLEVPRMCARISGQLRGDLATRYGFSCFCLWNIR
ncbi:MAG: hypothetical protein JWP34_4539 [Massilia sp.]|nr:hypothetical protein [Massilia sp.]